jgi:hypothetical protein
MRARTELEGKEGEQDEAKVKEGKEKTGADFVKSTLFYRHIHLFLTVNMPINDASDSTNKSED